MVKFVRRNIPSMSGSELILRVEYDTYMMNKALEEAMVASTKKNVYNYSYHDNNKKLLNTELRARHIQKEPVVLFKGQWTLVSDVINILEERIQFEKDDLEYLESIHSIKFSNEIINHRNDRINKYDEEIRSLKLEYE